MTIEKKGRTFIYKCGKKHDNKSAEIKTVKTIKQIKTREANNGTKE